MRHATYRKQSGPVLVACSMFSVLQFARFEITNRLPSANN